MFRMFVIIVGYYLFRRIQMKLYRKYHGLPPKGPTGITLFGVAFMQARVGGFAWYRRLTL